MSFNFCLIMARTVLFDNKLWLKNAATRARERGHDAIATLLDGLSPIPDNTLQEAKDSGRLAPGLIDHFPEQKDEMLKNLNNALLKAAETGDEEWFLELMDAGADINTFDEYGGTILMSAAHGGNVNIILFLLSQPQANVNATTPINKNTALMFAAEYGHLEVVRILLDHGAMTDVVNRVGDTALHKMGQPSNISPTFVATAQLLLDRGANPNSNT